MDRVNVQYPDFLRKGDLNLKVGFYVAYFYEGCLRQLK